MTGHDDQIGAGIGDGPEQGVVQIGGGIVADGGAGFGPDAVFVGLHGGEVGQFRGIFRRVVGGSAGRRRRDAHIDDAGVVEAGQIGAALQPFAKVADMQQIHGRHNLGKQFLPSWCIL